jgi:hypothetical protein
MKFKTTTDRREEITEEIISHKRAKNLSTMSRPILMRAGVVSVLRKLCYGSDRVLDSGGVVGHCDCNVVHIPVY